MGIEILPEQQLGAGTVTLGAERRMADKVSGWWQADGLTDADSGSLRHHAAMRLLLVAWYNSAREHETLKGNTAAMASNLADHVWTIKQLLERAAQS